MLIRSARLENQAGLVGASKLILVLYFVNIKVISKDE